MAAVAAGLMGLGQIPGRLLFALATHRLNPAATAAAVFGLAMAALGLLVAVRTGWAVLFIVLAFGLSSGMLTLLRASLIGELYGRTNYGAISGLVSASTLTARAAAPVGAALIALAPGGYTTLRLALTAIAGLGALAAARGIRQASELGWGSHVTPSVG